MNGGQVTSTSRPTTGLQTLAGPPDPPRWLAEPLTVDNRGRAALGTDDEHIADLIRAVLFTEPGERVNRPDFGCALKTMIFLPNHEALAAATTTLVHASLQQWLSGRITVVRVAVTVSDAVLQVLVVYRRVADGALRQVAVAQQIEGPQ
jgi:phage baseplate assembly protein W